MVFLKDLRTQWPWNKNTIERFEDKEIYTHTIYPNDASQEWRVPIYEPMHGYVYVGFRIVVEGEGDSYCMLTHLVMGASNPPRSVFGIPWDNMLCMNKEWKELVFPLTHRMIALHEDGMDLIIQHNRLCFGKVEMIAQRLEDFLEDESRIIYAFLLDRTQRVGWIMTPQGSFYRPEFSFVQENECIGPVKIVPSLSRILDKRMPLWGDTATQWKYISLREPISQIVELAFLDF